MMVHTLTSPKPCPAPPRSAPPRSWTWPFPPSGTVPPSNTDPLNPPPIPDPSPQLLLHVIMLVLTILASGFIIFLLFKPFIKDGLQVSVCGGGGRTTCR